MQIGATGFTKDLAIGQLVNEHLRRCQALGLDLTGAHIHFIAPVDQCPYGIGVKVTTGILKPIGRRGRGKDGTIHRAQQNIAGRQVNACNLTAYNPDPGIQQDVAVLSHHTNPTTSGGDVIMQGDRATACIQADVTAGGGDTATQVQHIDIASQGADVHRATRRLANSLHIDVACLLHHDDAGGQVRIPEIHSLNLYFERIRD